MFRSRTHEELHQPCLFDVGPEADIQSRPADGLTPYQAEVGGNGGNVGARARYRARKRGEDIPLLKRGKVSMFGLPAGTPEYRRLQRERDAQRQGRALAQYVPQAERETAALRARIEQRADSLRLRVMRQWLRDAVKIAVESGADGFQETWKGKYHNDPKFREQHKAEKRARYANNRAAEVARVARYKANHPERVRVWGVTRSKRTSAKLAGAATCEQIQHLKRSCPECAYCGRSLDAGEKHIDHMIAIGLGGRHTLRNIVIACADCNGRKGALSYSRWLYRVESQHFERVWKLWVKRYG